jgi:hypothetical protein
MAARRRTVTDPRGREWTVRRVLLPRPPRWKGPQPRRRNGREREDRGGSWGLESLDGMSGLGEIGDALGGVGAAIVAILLVIALLTFAWLVLFPALFFLADLLVLVLIAAGGVAVRVLFRRPWKIEATAPAVVEPVEVDLERDFWAGPAEPVTPPPETRTWGVVGLRASADAVDAVADAIQRGTPPDEIRLGHR